VKRAQGNKNKKRRRADGDSEPQEEIDPDEPRYCICDDVSFGQMISCDNNVGTWLHVSMSMLTTTSAKKSGSTSSVLAWPRKISLPDAPNGIVRTVGYR
jgi:hypothetical protein